MAYKVEQERLNELSFSVVIETENLGMAGIEDLEDTLSSLEAQTYSIKNAEEVLIIAAGHVAPETLEMLHSKYPWLTIHQEKNKMVYTDSKMRGAELSTGDIVLFADSDVVYDNTWLENMLYSFIWSKGASIVAGETSIDVTSFYRMAIQLVWMLNITLNKSHPKFHRNFYLNNFAIKREVMLSIPFPKSLPIYRAYIIEWIKILRDHGYSIVQAPNAGGFHAPPGNFWDYWYRMLIFGADEVVKGDFIFFSDGTVIEKRSFAGKIYNIFYYFLFRIFRILTRSCMYLKQSWTNIFYIIFSMPMVLISVFLILIGSITTLFNRDYLFNKISAREGEHIV